MFAEDNVYFMCAKHLSGHHRIAEKEFDLAAFGGKFHSCAVLLDKELTLLFLQEQKLCRKKASLNFVIFMGLNDMKMVHCS